MARRPLTVAVCLMVCFWVGFGGLADAQPKTDARFEEVSKELYPKAKQEGEVIAYTIWDVADIVAMLDAFSKQFPGIKTSYWQAENSAIANRVITEFQSGKASVDVLLTNQTVPVLRSAGTIMPYETVQKDSLLIHEPTLPLVGLNVQALTYNTKK